MATALPASSGRHAGVQWHSSRRRFSRRQKPVVTLIASVAGVIAGLAIAPFFLTRSAELLGVTAAPVIDLLLIAITVGVVLLIVAASTALSAWNAGRVSTVQALTSKTQAGVRRSILGSLAARLRLLPQQHRALPLFLEEYNGDRPHTALGGLPPLSRICQ